MRRGLVVALGCLLVTSCGIIADEEREEAEQIAEATRGIHVEWSLDQLRLLVQPGYEVTADVAFPLLDATHESRVRIDETASPGGAGELADLRSTLDRMPAPFVHANTGSATEDLWLWCGSRVYVSATSQSRYGRVDGKIERTPQGIIAELGRRVGGVPAIRIVFTSRQL